MNFQLRWILPLAVVDVHSESEKNPDYNLTVERLKKWEADHGQIPALKFVYEERKITASGHETTDTDPGIATTKDDCSLETYILSTNHHQIELLTNLDQLPESVAVVVVSFPKPKGGSGFPARVFAILP